MVYSVVQVSPTRVEYFFFLFSLFNLMAFDITHSDQFGWRVDCTTNGITNTCKHVVFGLRRSIHELVRRSDAILMLFIYFVPYNFTQKFDEWAFLW